MAMREVRTEVSANRYLNYANLRWYMSRLNENAKEILTDYIVISYQPFDKDLLMSYYSDISQLVGAMKASAGSEYDLREKVTPHSDLLYERMKEVVRTETGLDMVRKVVMFPLERKMELVQVIRRAVPAAELYQICKFLHIKTI